jgi:hypothetical protein
MTLRREERDSQTPCPVVNFGKRVKVRERICPAGAGTMTRTRVLSMGDNELTAGLADWVEVKGRPGHAVPGEIISPRKMPRKNSCGVALCVPKTIGEWN